MIRIVIALLPALLLCSCGTTAQHGWTAWGQERHTLNTAQTCVRGEDAARLADRVLPAYLAELKAAGHVKLTWSEIVERDRRWPGRPIVGVCLVPEPEACCISGACAGPRKGALVARKSGCASDAHAWASLSWPPVCRPEWPDEPHCVQGAADVRSDGWQARLAHELFNVAILRWANYQASAGNHYNDQIYEVERRVRAQLGL